MIATRRPETCRSGRGRSWGARRLLGTDGWLGAAFLLDLAARGRHDLGAIVGTTYSLDDIEAGFRDQFEGHTVRAVLDLRS